MSKAVLEKTIARLFAVQALYSHDVKGEDSKGEDSTKDMMDILKGDSSLEKDAKVDEKFFIKVTEGVKENRDEIDDIIEQYLEKGWTLEKLGALLRCILRSAVFELKYIETIPATVTINEYVDIAADFFDESDYGEIGFVNAILDRIAGSLRPN